MLQRVRAEFSAAPRLAGEEPSTEMTEQESAARLPGSPNWKDAVAEDLETWRAFRRGLAPSYLSVWCDIVLCYAIIIAALVLGASVERTWGVVTSLAAAPAFALVIGFWLHALSLFGHEAGHYNLAKGHALNDSLAEWFIWPLFGVTIKTYRKSHWQHHLHLGDPNDTEISYHNCLSPWFLLKMLTGIYLFQVLVRYARTNRKLSAESAADPTGDRLEPGSALLPLVRAIAVQIPILGLLLWWECWVTSVTWIASVVVMYPFISTLRQVLEHRRIEARCDEDFLHSEHGPVLRMLGGGVFSRYFGAAGFDRHLLHHWDPSISYTCFNEMENFLMQTPLCTQLAVSRSTYISTFLDMIRSARHGSDA